MDQTAWNSPAALRYSKETFMVMMILMMMFMVMTMMFMMTMMMMVMMSRLPSGARLPTDGRRQKAATEPQMLSFHGSSSYSFFIMVVIIMMLIHSPKSFQNIATSETIPKFYRSAKLARTQISSQGGRWQAAITAAYFPPNQTQKSATDQKHPTLVLTKYAHSNHHRSLGLGIG